MLLTELLSHDDLRETENNPDIRGVTADSREVGPGFLFAALAGTQANGADFIPDALARGAVAILGDDNLPLKNTASAIFVRDPNPRRRLAEIAARFYPRQPPNVVAITGTNGKTSVASFARQIWQELGYRSATIGTLGAQWRGHVQILPTTTPEPVSLHQLLDRFSAEEVDHVAIEASSHGLDQHRLDGVRVSHAAFTNLSHDHLDYHGSPEAYLTAKTRLFTEILVEGGTAVLNAEASEFHHLVTVCRTRGHSILSYGVNQADICIERLSVTQKGQEIGLSVHGKSYQIHLPLVGAVQVDNALCALGLVLASGAVEEDAIAALGSLAAVPGRLEKVGTHPLGAAVYVDYAHTPHALENALQSLRPVVSGKIVAVIGAGGDRDQDKRSAMGEIAAHLADSVIVTDDNPRGEDPAAIRSAILSRCVGAKEIADRAEAIRYGLGLLRTGDTLLIAGKGHEHGQRIGDELLPFDDSDVARRAIAEIESSEV